MQAKPERKPGRVISTDYILSLLFVIFLLLFLVLCLSSLLWVLLPTLLLELSSLKFKSDSGIFLLLLSLGW